MRAVVIHAPKDLRIDSYPDAARARAKSASRLRTAASAAPICTTIITAVSASCASAADGAGPRDRGVVAAVGDGVANVKPGTRVAVNPSRPCGQCLHCQEGMRNQCLDMRFLGSAMRFPHVQGGFREFITVDAAQAVPIADKLSLAEAAVAEPLAVCLHAGKQAGPLLGKRVLITGCGPIGALMILVSRFGGASEIVVTDVADAPLAVARKLGATHAINVAADATALDPWRAGKGVFDTLFEASGNQAALRTALDVLRPGARWCSSVSAAR